MRLERARNRREVLFAGAAIGVAWVCGGCSDDEEDDPLWRSIRYADAGLEQGFQTMYARLSPEDRSMLDHEIIKKTDVRIHVIRGKLAEKDSRGGASAPHLKAVEDGWCSQDKHPDAKGVRKRRNWDLMYDGQMAQAWEEKNGIYNQIDAILYHEIFGHILRTLMNPGLIEHIKENEHGFDDDENEARAIENRYRRYRKYPIVPDVLPRLPSHE